MPRQVLYKKLMGQPPVFDDLRELHPDVHVNLGKLLTHATGDVEEFELFFQVTMQWEGCKGLTGDQEGMRWGGGQNTA